MVKGKSECHDVSLMFVWHPFLDHIAKSLFPSALMETSLTPTTRMNRPSEKEASRGSHGSR